MPLEENEKKLVKQWQKEAWHQHYKNARLSVKEWADLAEELDDIIHDLVSSENED